MQSSTRFTIEYFLESLLFIDVFNRMKPRYNLRTQASKIRILSGSHASSLSASFRV
jgi:hypothetical protein